MAEKFNSEKDVHTEHCCIQHGCKYCDDDCPVVNGIKTQSFECEDCDHDSDFAYEQAIDFAIELDNKEGIEFLKSLRSEDFSVVKSRYPSFSQKLGSSFFNNEWKY
ncbi:hypothetical protein PBI_SCTP2_371 [Salicola phage SCTP-2]|nr:hypothetical protein PBI_SCTP2_371 [Salicola phage SCTP-2]